MSTGGASASWSSNNWGNVYGSPAVNSKYYIPDNFEFCEKCGHHISHHMNIYGGNVVYSCPGCKFKKSFSHVSFGHIIKKPNYLSLTKTHCADNLYYSDGVSIKTRLTKTKEFYTPQISKAVAHRKWEMWANDNLIEIANLASLSENHTLGADPNLPYEDNPMEHLWEYIKDVQGIYLHGTTIKLNKKNHRNKTIGHAIEYCLRKSKSVLWIGESFHKNTEQSLANACIRLHKPYYGIHQFNRLADIEDIQSHTATPVYVTGPTVFTSKRDQEFLDKAVDKFMTNLNNSILFDKDKIRVIVNTGNTGVETSAIRWAIKNNIYCVVVNIPGYMYLNEAGYNRYDGNFEHTVNRILNGRISEDPVVQEIVEFTL